MLLSIVVFALLATLFAMVGKSYERDRLQRRLLERSRRDVDATMDNDRLARLEQAVDAMAIELERLGEGQRFVTKLLVERTRADRTPPSPQPGAVRAVSPPTA